MNYKHATVAETEKHIPTNLVKLSNPFHFHKEPSIDPHRIQKLGITMRIRWEAYHTNNGTWYDYSDLEYDDSEEDDDDWDDEEGDDI